MTGLFNFSARLIAGVFSRFPVAGFPVANRPTTASFARTRNLVGLAAAGFLVSVGPALGSNITVDFEDVSSGSYAEVTSRGFTFTYIPDGTSLTALVNGGRYISCTTCGTSFTSSLTDTFDLLEIDLISETPVPAPGTDHIYLASFTGHLQGGGMVTAGEFLGPDTSVTRVFDSSWVNLTSVDVVYSNAPFLDDPLLAAISIDNVKTSVIPVPAALWLFGSALALLARRRKGS